MLAGGVAAPILNSSFLIRRPILGGAVVMIMRRERALRSDFIAAGATQPADAKSLAELGLDENMTWKRMCRRSVIREPAPGLFYWDEDVWQALRSMRVRMALMMTGAVLLIVLMIAYGSTKLQ